MSLGDSGLRLPIPASCPIPKGQTEGRGSSRTDTGPQRGVCFSSRTLLWAQKGLLCSMFNTKWQQTICSCNKINHRVSREIYRGSKAGAEPGNPGWATGPVPAAQSAAGHMSRPSASLCQSGADRLRHTGSQPSMLSRLDRTLPFMGLPHRHSGAV